jgi:hypothetical protein
MTVELLHLDQELHKIRAYFVRYPKDAKLDFIIIQKPTINNIYEFEVPEVRRQLWLHHFGPENLQPSLLQAELLLRQLPVIQYLGKKPCGNLPEV